MTSQIPGTPAEGIAAAGLGAVIPTALLVALLGRQSTLPTEPVTVDARSLQVAVPPEAVADLLRTLSPDRPISVTFTTDAITVTSAGLPAIRIQIPAEGLRIHVDERGLRLGDR